MLLATVLVTFAIAAAQPTAGERDLATQFPAEVVDCVVAARLDLSRAEETLKGLFQRLPAPPPRPLHLLPTPRHGRARLVFGLGTHDHHQLVAVQGSPPSDLAAPASLPEQGWYVAAHHAIRRLG